MARSMEILKPAELLLLLLRRRGGGGSPALACRLWPVAQGQWSWPHAHTGLARTVGGFKEVWRRRRRQRSSRRPEPAELAGEQQVARLAKAPGAQWIEQDDGVLLRLAGPRPSLPESCARRQARPSWLAGERMTCAGKRADSSQSNKSLAARKHRQHAAWPPPPPPPSPAPWRDQLATLGFCNSCQHSTGWLVSRNASLKTVGPAPAASLRLQFECRHCEPSRRGTRKPATHCRLSCRLTVSLASPLAS